MLWIGRGNPYPDPTFHFDVDPDFDLDPEPAPRFTHIRGNQNFFAFTHSRASLHCFIFLVMVIGVTILNILYIILTFSGKKYGTCNLS